MLNLQSICFCSAIKDLQKLRLRFVRIRKSLILVLTPTLNQTLTLVLILTLILNQIKNLTQDIRQSVLRVRLAPLAVSGNAIK